MRLFLAVELPASLKRELAGLPGRLREELHGWRWVRPEGLHLTLRFLGSVEPALDLRARAAWRAAAAAVPSFHVRATGLGRFPERGRPRVLWVGIAETEHGRALATLAGSLESAARAQGLAPEPRPFTPHLTLARAARGALPEVPDSGAARSEAGGWIERLVLFQSHLSPAGASYTALEAFPLATRPRASEGRGAA